MYSSIINNSPKKRLQILSNPVPKYLDSITLKVIRKTSIWNRMFPVIQLEDLNYNKLLLNARKMFGNKTTNFHITTESNIFTKE